MAANFWRDIVPLPVTENFSKFLSKKTKIICYASNKIGMKEVTAHLGDHFFWYSLDVNLGKIKKPNFGANFFKIFSLEHHKKNEWKIRVGNPFTKV